jgi:hypothetical protein
MAFTQVDENTVQDDEGNKYYLPGLLGAPASVAPVPSPSGGADAPVPTSQEILDKDPSLAPAETPPTQVPLKPGTETTVNVPQVDAQATPLQAGVKKQVDTKAAAQAGRNNLIENDITSFAGQGGTINTDEDLSRMAAGLAGHQAETAKAQAEATNIQNQANAEALAAKGRAAMAVASEYERQINENQAEAQKRWAVYQQHVQAQSQETVDPRHAFHSMGTTDKIMWAIQFLGAGMQGGNAVAQTSQLLNKLVDDDITAQKFNIENHRQGLENERGMLQAMDKSGMDSIEKHYAARQVRLDAIGKLLDAKAAQVGNAAAQKAGLLHARDLIEAEVSKTEGEVQKHHFEMAKQKDDQSFQYGKLRLEHEYKMIEQAQQEKLKQGGESATLPTGTGQAIQLVDRTTGKAVGATELPLKNGVKGESAVKAGQVISTAEQRGTLLNEVKDALANTSESDLIRGGAPELASKIEELVQARAQSVNGHRLSDDDMKRAAKAEFGVELGDGIIKNALMLGRVPGNFKEGLNNTIEGHLRNLDTETKAQLEPYVDSKYLQSFDINVTPRSTHVPAPSKDTPDINTEMTKAAGGEVTGLVPGSRPPVKSAGVPLTPQAEEEFKAAQAKERGLQGGLPKLAPKDEATVTDASKSFENRPSDDILKLSQQYLKRKDLSEEAKYEIRLEAQEAMRDSLTKETAVKEEAKDYYESLAQLSKATGKDAKVEIGGKKVDMGASRKDNLEFNPTFKKWFEESDTVNEMRVRAGLVPYKR